MDRQKKDKLPKMQCDFITNICSPIYEVCSNTGYVEFLSVYFIFKICYPYAPTCKNIHRTCLCICVCVHVRVCLTMIYFTYSIVFFNFSIFLMPHHH